MHYLAPLRCLAQNQTLNPKSLWHYLAQMAHALVEHLLASTQNLSS